MHDGKLELARSNRIGSHRIFRGYFSHETAIEHLQESMPSKMPTQICVLGLVSSVCSAENVLFVDLDQKFDILRLMEV